MLKISSTRVSAGRTLAALLVPVVGAFLLWPGFVQLMDATTGHEGHAEGLVFDPLLVGVHTLANILIGLSYVAISGGLAYLAYRAHRDIPFHEVLLAFGLFIISCGIGHFMHVLTPWIPVYWLSAIVMAVTAVSSMVVAIMLPGLLPHILNLISETKVGAYRKQQLEVANQALVVANNELLAEVTARTHMGDALRESEERSRTLLASLPQSIIFKDRRSVFISVNKTVAHDLGMEPEDFVGKTDYDLYAPELAAKYVADDNLVMESRQTKTVQEVNMAAEGPRIVEAVKAPVMGPDNEVIGVLCIFTDITERMSAEEALRELTVRDELTGLYNRRALNQMLGEEIKRSERYGSLLSVVLIDIDHFKSVNDTYGHQVGDLVLKWVAEMVRLRSRSVDKVARYGGEELAILMPETSISVAHLLAEDLREHFASVAFAFERDDKVAAPIRITISAGVSVLGGVVSSVDELISAADEALYQAKRRGRNRVVAAPGASSSITPLTTILGPTGPLGPTRTDTNLHTRDLTVVL